MFKKISSFTVVVCFFLTSLTPYRQALADAPLDLPTPGTMINLSPAYQPVIIKGLTVHKDNPFLFDFIVDVGQDKMAGEPLKKEGEKLIKYFLAGLAIPDRDLWVNLSPYEKNKMVPEALGQTDMGRDLLEQDYILKQITASLIYPEKQLGKTFWDRVYSKAQEMYGTTKLPVNTFNKVWIMADRAEVFEHNQTAFVVDSHLKVMLEEDYLALQKHTAVPSSRMHSLSSEIVKQIVLPELEKEVNTGKNFANLRQIFNSIILSSWYKKNLKAALLNQIYANKAKVKGINLNDPTIKQQIYEQYLKAYKKGVFNYIKEEMGAQGAMEPRKYFSGGMMPGAAADPAMTSDPGMLSKSFTNNALVDFATLASTKSTNFDEDKSGNPANSKEIDLRIEIQDIIKAIHHKYSDTTLSLNENNQLIISLRVNAPNESTQLSSIRRSIDSLELTPYIDVREAMSEKPLTKNFVISSKVNISTDIWLGRIIEFLKSWGSSSYYDQAMSTDETINELMKLDHYDSLTFDDWNAVRAVLDHTMDEEEAIKQIRDHRNRSETFVRDLLTFAKSLKTGTPYVNDKFAPFKNIVAQSIDPAMLGNNLPVYEPGTMVPVDVRKRIGSEREAANVIDSEEKRLTVLSRANRTLNYYPDNNGNPTADAAMATQTIQIGGKQVNASSALNAMESMRLFLGRPHITNDSRIRGSVLDYVDPKAPKEIRQTAKAIVSDFIKSKLGLTQSPFSEAIQFAGWENTAKSLPMLAKTTISLLQIEEMKAKAALSSGAPYTLGEGSRSFKIPGKPTKLKLKDLNKDMRQGVDELVKMFGWDMANVQILDKDFDKQRLIAEEIAEGEKTGQFIKLEDGNYFAQSHPKDVQRAPPRTFVSTANPDDKGLRNNWRNEEELRSHIIELMQQDAKPADTVYVLPYLRGPVGSPFSKVGVQITTDRQVAIQIMTLYKVGWPAVDHLKDSPHFTKGANVPGNLDHIWSIIEKGGPDGRHFAAFLNRREFLSRGSAYGGNAILPKKFELRQGMWDSVEAILNQGKVFLSEHMFILQITEKKTGSKFNILGAFPAASGKTNLGMIELPDELKDEFTAEVISDDLADLFMAEAPDMYTPEEMGHLYAINPEDGIFGVIYGTGWDSNSALMKSLKPNSDIIYTNIAINRKLRQAWWEGKTPGFPSYDENAQYWEDWTGKRIIDRVVTDADVSKKYGNKKQLEGLTPQELWELKAAKGVWAHANSRASVPMESIINLSPDFYNPKGVKIDAILWGGKSDHHPLLYIPYDSVEGITDGTSAAAKSTAATEGAVGLLDADPNAQKWFMGPPEPRYFAAWLKIRKILGDKMPLIAHLNQIQPDWEGFGKNGHLIKPLINFLKGDRSKFRREALGFVPSVDTFPLSYLKNPRTKKPLTREELSSMLSVDPYHWYYKEMGRRKQYYDELDAASPKDKVPQALRDKNDEIKHRFENEIARRELGRIEQALFNNPELSVRDGQWSVVLLENSGYPIFQPLQTEIWSAFRMAGMENKLSIKTVSNDNKHALILFGEGKESEDLLSAIAQLKAPLDLIKSKIPSLDAAMTATLVTRPDIKRIGVLTGGGLATGHNSLITAAVREAMKQGVEIIGIPNGWAGLKDSTYRDRIKPLTVADMERVETKGGSLIRSSRTNPLKVSDDELKKELQVFGFSDSNPAPAETVEQVRSGLVKKKVDVLLKNIKELNIDGLIVMGGDDTNGVSSIIHAYAPDFPILGVPKTMDNDIYLPEGVPTYGYDSYITAASESLHRMLVSTRDQDRIFVVEVFGRDAGFTALGAGARVGATLTLIPEEGKINVDDVVNKIREFYIKNKHALIVVSEGVEFEESKDTQGPVDEFGHKKLGGAAETLQNLLKERLSDIKGLTVTVPGKLDYAFREAPVSLKDYMITQALGTTAVQFLREGMTGKILYANANYTVKAMSFPDEHGVVTYVDEHGQVQHMNISKLRGDKVDISADEKRKIGGREAHIKEGGSDYHTYIAANLGLFGEESTVTRIILELKRIQGEMRLSVAKMEDLLKLRTELKDLKFVIKDLKSTPDNEKSHLKNNADEIESELSRLIKAEAVRMSEKEIDSAMNAKELETLKADIVKAILDFFQESDLGHDNVSVLVDNENKMSILHGQNGLVVTIPDHIPTDATIDQMLVRVSGIHSGFGKGSIGGLRAAISQVYLNKRVQLAVLKFFKDSRGLNYTDVSVTNGDAVSVVQVGQQINVTLPTGIPSAQQIAQANIRVAGVPSGNGMGTMGGMRFYMMQAYQNPLSLTLDAAMFSEVFDRMPGEVYNKTAPLALLDESMTLSSDPIVFPNSPVNKAEEFSRVIVKNVLASMVVRYTLRSALRDLRGKNYTRRLPRSIRAETIVRNLASEVPPELASKFRFWATNKGLFAFSGDDDAYNKWLERWAQERLYQLPTSKDEAMKTNGKGATNGGGVADIHKAYINTLSIKRDHGGYLDSVGLSQMIAFYQKNWDQLEPSQQDQVLDLLPAVIKPKQIVTIFRSMQPGNFYQKMLPAAAPYADSAQLAVLIKSDMMDQHRANIALMGVKKVFRQYLSTEDRSKIIRFYDQRWFDLKEDVQDEAVTFLAPAIDPKEITEALKPIKNMNFQLALMTAIGKLQDRAQITTPGGIDLNTSNGMQWKTSKDGHGVEINIDPAMLERIKQEGIDSLSPIVYRMTPVTNVWNYIGLAAPPYHV
jgi:phosphoenolpyruvate carboxykinase (GTP)